MYRGFRTISCQAGTSNATSAGAEVAYDVGWPVGSTNFPSHTHHIFGSFDRALVMSQSTPSSATVADAQSRALVVVNRGILTATAFCGSLFVCVLLTDAASAGGTWAGGLGALALGGAAGCIVATSRKESGSDSSEQNVIDAAMTIVWIVLLASAFNLLYPATIGESGRLLLEAPLLMRLFAWFAAGAAVAAIRGTAVLRWIANKPIKGRRPFVAVIDVTKSIEHPDVRFVTRVLAESATAVALAVLAYIGAIVVLAVLAILAGLWVLSAAMSDSDSESVSASESPGGELRSRGGGFFATACATCGSTEHATSDCPHGILSSECANCGSKNHATADCPHGLFSSKCAGCGSKDHATSDCPHGILSTECASCGSKNHATADCPHGLFSSKCATCGSRDHATSDCPH